MNSIPGTRSVPVRSGIAGDVSQRQLWRLWARVALQSFGGPAGQIAVLHRLIVQEKQWLSEARFLHALSYCMLLPGPEAQQLSTYVGWLLGGVRGGLIAGLLFIAPGFLSILALSVLYAGYRDVGIVAGLFYGLKPAVIAVVLEALHRLRRRALAERLSLLIAAGAFVAIFVFDVPFPAIVLAAALCGVLAGRARSAAAESVDDAEVVEQRPSLLAAGRTAVLWLVIWLAPLALLYAALGPAHVFVQEGVFFSKAALVTFGGAYSVLSYVAQQAVETHRWLTPGQMVDGLAMAETTPGPLIQVVQFVGFMGAYHQPGSLSPLTAGIIGSVITTWVTFAPCFLFIFVGAPFVEYVRQNRWLRAALSGISAAVVGVVLNLAVWFALHTLFGEVRTFGAGPVDLLLPLPATLDLGAALITVASVLAVFRWKVGVLPLLGAAALAGIVFHEVLGWR
jgi:chromate transporter